MFRGNAPARIDEKGRLKVPTTFKSLLESKYGRELFLTSLTGEYVRDLPDAGLARARAEAQRGALHESVEGSASSIASITTVRPVNSIPRGAC